MQNFGIIFGLLIAISSTNLVSGQYQGLQFDACDNDEDETCFVSRSNQEDDGFDNCEDDDEDGTCSISKSKQDDDDDIKSKFEDFENEAVKKAVGVLKALGFTTADGEESYPPGDSRSPRFESSFFGFESFRQTAIDNALAVLRIFGFDGMELNEIPYKPDITIATPAMKISLPPVIITPQAAKDRNIANYEPCRGGEGVCTSSYECENMGGEPIGKCGNCIGCSVCCQFVTGCQGMTDKMITYFQSPGYPRTDRTNEACSLTLNVREEVTQIRLDFVDFEMAAPLRGSCAGVDNFEIINTAQPGGVLGPGNSQLCGLNSGQHMYVPAKPGNILILKATTSGVRNIPLARTDGSNRGLSGDTAFRWNVRVTQIPYEGPVIQGTGSLSIPKRGKIPKHYENLMAPDGCRQYFKDTRGNLKSFNFDGRSELALNLNYAICVKRPFDSCGMTLNALTFSIPASVMCLPGNVAVDSGAETPSPCCTGVGTIDDKKKHPKDPKLPYGPGVNYLGFSALSDGAARQTGRGQDYRRNQDRFFFCGERLGATNLVVGRTKGPLVLRVRSADTYWGEIDEEKTKEKEAKEEDDKKKKEHGTLPVWGSEYCPEDGCLGFLIKYDVDTGSC